jgi:Fic family protein
MKSLEELNDLKIIKEIDSMKSGIDKLRPLTSEQEDRIMQKFRLDWNYHSNAIEGNKLNFGETKAFLMYGITAKGKPLKDHLDIKGHNEAIYFLENIVKKNENFTETDIRALHKVILVEEYEIKAETMDGTIVKKMVKLGTYKTLPNHVKTLTGEIHYYATPEETPIKMKELMDWYSEVKDSNMHPLIIASIFHYQFVAIHPFDDGNGRIARLFMNLILMRNHFPPVIIKIEDRERYYLALSQADSKQFKPFIEFIGKELLRSLDIYLRGARGESIEEPEDLDKDILLFKKELEGRKDKLELKLTQEVVKDIYEKVGKELINELEVTFSKFKEMFLTHAYSLIIQKDGKWSYVPHKDILSLQEGIESSGFKTIWYPTVISYRLNELKAAENPFSVELKIFIYFDTYKYKIYSTISEVDELSNISVSNYVLNLPEPDVTNYYHLTIGKDEIKKICNQAGQKLLEYIKNEYKTKNHYYTIITTEQLNILWSNYLDENVLDDKQKNILKNNNPKIQNGKFLVFVKVLPAHKIYFNNQLNNFLKYINEKVKIERGIGFLPIP